MSDPIALSRIEDAYAAISYVFRDSPQYESESLSHLLGASLVIKLETANPIGSFKGRGADWWAKNNPEIRDIVCVSAGNFGQGMAYAARAHGAALHVFAATGANPGKVEAMKRFGAKVHQPADNYADSGRAAKAFAARNGFHFLLDGEAPEITEGAGTIGKELASFPEPIDVVFVPVGDGALINGIGTWFKGHSPATRIVGVCAAGAPAMYQSWKAGKVISTKRTDTIADGIAISEPIPTSVALMRKTTDDIVLIDDTDTIAAMRLLFQSEHIVAEPAGAIALAAALAQKDRIQGQRVAVIVTGANIQAESAPRWLFE